MPVPCAFFFSAEFFSAPCTDAGRMLPGAGRWEFGPRGEGAGAPGRKSGTKVRLGSPGQGCGTESGALFPEFGTEAPGRDSGRSCEGRVPEQGSACRIGPSEAGAGRRFLHRGIGCSPGEGAGAPGRDSESLPEDRLRVLRFRGRVRAPRPVPWTVPGIAPGVVLRGGSHGRVSWSAAGFRGRFRGACAGRRFPGSDRAVCRRPSACAESFPGRKRFPRPMSEGAEIRGPLSRAEAARGVPEVGFPGRGPAAGHFCDGRILRRRIGAIRLRP